MPEVLKRNEDGSFNVIYSNEIQEAQEFAGWCYGVFYEGRITEVIEQRKERGIYKDESKRRFWARIIGV